MSGATGFWAGYWKSLKPLSVEEPIDVWVHRPLAYLLARALLPTPVSANLVTFCSILLGVAAGAAYVWPGPHHMQWAGLLLFSSAVFDCADGQLARLRRSSSPFGRMLDGTADLIVSVAAVGGAMYVTVARHTEPLWMGAATLAVCIATAVTGSFQTTMYDHYKNVYLRMTTATFNEAEDYEDALERYRRRPAAEFGLGARIAWPIYFFYMKSQSDYVRGFDPFTAWQLSRLPAFSEASAAVYRAEVEDVMRTWRRYMGFGSLMFGIAVSTVFDILDFYVVFRLVAMNLLFFLYLRPRQREASRRAFSRLGVTVTG